MVLLRRLWSLFLPIATVVVVVVAAVLGGGVSTPCTCFTDNIAAVELWRPRQKLIAESVLRCLFEPFFVSCFLIFPIFHYFPRGEGGGGGIFAKV